MPFHPRPARSRGFYDKWMILCFFCVFTGTKVAYV